MSGTIGHGHRRPYAPDRSHLGAIIHPITTRTLIIVIITLTSNKHAIVKVNFFIRDSIYQEPRQSTSHPEARPRGFIPLEKAIKNSADLCGVMGQNNARQKALYPYLSAIVYKSL
jgi:hypothetical protein